MISNLNELKLWMLPVIIWLLLGLTWAHAQTQPTQRVWALRDIGRSHGYVTEPGMPKCNLAVSEECRRLYGGTAKQNRTRR
jgi:hypothetical protein